MKKSSKNIVKEAELKVFVEKDNEYKKVKLSNTTSVKDILKQLSILSSVSIVVINDEVVTEDEIVKEKDKIRILSVISGG
ncbi:MAG: MoaD/ThiS family protein [Candidatus Woesearchaeota archaeon]|jgi:sulfur carrier protein ThiS